MASSFLCIAALRVSDRHCLRLSENVNDSIFRIRPCHQSTLNCQITHPRISQFRFSGGRGRLSISNAQSNEGLDSDELIEELRVPDQWLQPSKALEESEWLRNALKKWLDDEYCPEETNFEISKVAASSFYRSLLEKKSDIGEILLTMAGELESISYQESFHGAFSSANAAVNLILQRLEQN